MIGPRHRLSDPPFKGRTGRGVRIAVVDSGVAQNHPHVGGLVAAGISLVGVESDTGDRIGHGTAVSAAIREKAPNAELVPVRVFDRDLATDAATLARAIRWAAGEGCQLINLSLGTPNFMHEALLREAVQHANAANCLVVAAFAVDGVPQLPGALAGIQVAGVEAAREFARDEFAVARGDGGIGILCRASIYPRPIPGVEPHRNLSGVSFAVANATAFLALRLEDSNLATLFEEFHQ